ncbi:hypothetical protein MRB53_040034 [Persea americana]|nr:hypothetical protein MRB53_040034 [Persea americana]
MPPAEPPTQITIRVKVPPGHILGAQHDEFSLGILSTSLTIEALRQRIQTLIPTNPAPAQQRMLYGGRALSEDRQSIADALNTRRDPSQNEYVIHLLIRDGARARPPQQQPGHGHIHRGLSHDPPFNAPETMATGVPQANPLMNQEMLQQLQDQADQVIQMVHDRGQAGFQNVQHNGSANTEQTTSNLQSHNTNQAIPTPTGAQPTPRPHHHHHHHHHRQPHFHPDPNARPVPQTIPRPISGQGVHVSGTGPNGQHFTYHHQTFAVPTAHLQHAHAGGMPMPFPPMPGFPMQHQHLQRSASQNDATRQQSTDNQSGQSTSGDSDTQAMNPPQPNQFVMPTMEDMLAAHRARSQFHSPGLPRLPISPFAPGYNHFGMPAHPADAFRPFSGMPMIQPHVATDHVSVYLLSSPQGPQALVFDSQHGPYAGALHPLQPQSPTAPTQTNVPTPVQPPAVAQPNAQPGQAAPAQPDNFAILQPLLGHLCIDCYWILLLRLGLFGNGGVIRRWWDGIVRVEDVRERLQRLGLPVEGQGQANPAQPAADTARQFPTPEELAQRLVQEQRDRSALHRFREQIRPVERAFALFVASLWPGVGERYVRALDEAREVEEAARRLLQAQREAAAQEAAQREADAKNEEDKQVENKEGDSAGAVNAEVATNVGESASKTAPIAQEQVHES